MSRLLLTGEVMPPDEVYAYRQGERACLEGTGFWTKPYTFDPKGDNSLLYAFIDGFFDTEKRLVREREQAKAAALVEARAA